MGVVEQVGLDNERWARSAEITLHGNCHEVATFHGAQPSVSWRDSGRNQMFPLTMMD